MPFFQLRRHVVPRTVREAPDASRRKRSRWSLLRGAKGGMINEEVARGELWRAAAEEKREEEQAAEEYARLERLQRARLQRAKTAGLAPTTTQHATQQLPTPTALSSTGGWERVEQRRRSEPWRHVSVSAPVSRGGSRPPTPPLNGDLVSDPPPLRMRPLETPSARQRTSPPLLPSPTDTPAPSSTASAPRRFVSSASTQTVTTAEAATQTSEPSPGSIATAVDLAATANAAAIVSGFPAWADGAAATTAEHGCSASPHGATDAWEESSPRPPPPPPPPPLTVREIVLQAEQLEAAVARERAARCALELERASRRRSVTASATASASRRLSLLRSRVLHLARPPPPTSSGGSSSSGSRARVGVAAPPVPPPRGIRAGSESPPSPPPRRRNTPLPQPQPLPPSGDFPSPPHRPPPAGGRLGLSELAAAAYTRAWVDAAPAERASPSGDPGGVSTREVTAPSPFTATLLAAEKRLEEARSSAARLGCTTTRAMPILGGPHRHPNSRGSLLPAFTADAGNDSSHGSLLSDSTSELGARWDGLRSALDRSWRWAQSELVGAARALADAATTASAAVVTPPRQHQQHPQPVACELPEFLPAQLAGDGASDMLEGGEPSAEAPPPHPKRAAVYNMGNGAPHTPAEGPEPSPTAVLGQLGAVQVVRVAVAHVDGVIRPALPPELEPFHFQSFV